MKNKYFPDEDIEKDDLYFTCYMIERVARHLHQRNRYVVNAIGKDEFYHLLSVANVLHSENPLKVEDDWIKDYDLKAGDYLLHMLKIKLPEFLCRTRFYGIFTSIRNTLINMFNSVKTKEKSVFSDFVVYSTDYFTPK